MINTVNEVIKALPPLSKTVKEFEEVYKDPKSDVEDYAQIIIKDPMLTADLLKLANSSIYGFTQKIKTLEQAISLFGVKTVRSLVLNHELQKIFINEPLIYELSIEQLSRLNFKQAELALRYTNLIDKSLVEDAFLITLLSDMGKLVISKVYDKDSEFKKELESAKSLLQVKKVEKKYLGLTSEGISAKMFKEWNLDDTLVQSLGYLSNKSEAGKKIKKLALIIWIVKTALNYKQRLSQKSVINADKIAYRYKFAPLSKIAASVKVNTL